nr:restriction endonuclease subunit S [Lentibacillus saliphilus]
MLEEAIVPEEEQTYEVPENWIWSRLGDLVKVQTGKKDANHGTEDGRYPFFTCASKPIKSETYSFEGESILLPGNGANVGLTLFYEGKFEAYQRTYVLNGFQGYMKYLYYQLLFGWKNYNANKQYGSATNYIKLGNITQYVIPLPPLNEQKRIAEKVERLLSKIDEAKQLIEEAKETFELRRAAILDKAFRGELTRKWREDNGIDFNWVDTRFENLIETGPQNGLYKPQSAYGKGTMIVRIDNFYNGKVNSWETLKRLQLDEREKELYALKNDNIIINRVNSIEYLGKSALIKNLDDSCVFESNVMRLSLNEKVNPDYLILFLNSQMGLQELRKNAKHAVNQASINQQDVKNVLIPLPKIEEQLEIIRLLNNLMSNKDKASKYLEMNNVIDSLKQTILSKAFRGELGTNDQSEESAIELLKKVLEEQVK